MPSSWLIAACIAVFCVVVVIAVVVAVLVLLAGTATIIIAWALPTGQIVLVSDVFLGRVSEATMVQAHEPWLRVFGAGTYIVADKGATLFDGAIVCGCARTTHAVT